MIKEDCVMYDTKEQECAALKVCDCKRCRFYKTNREYVIQTGTTYKKAMKCIGGYTRSPKNER